MTDQDNLRNRIADILEGWDVRDNDAIIRADTAADIAQAVIDSLSLTLEHGAAFSEFDMRSVIDRDDAEQTARWNPGMYPVSRIVGKWED